MVCALGESQALCIVRDLSTNQDGSAPIYECHVPGSTTVRDFVQQVASHFSHEPQNIELILSLPKGEEVKLKESSDETLQSSGVRTDNNSRNSFILQTLKTARARASPRTKELDEELNLGASASPTTAGDYPTYHIPSFLSSQENPPYNTAGLIKQDTGYVGLVNQAMTCYLNSLLQALFMTPEFRNALYKWQYDPQNNSDPAKCIPYQLQRLFLNLQSTDTLIQSHNIAKHTQQTKMANRRRIAPTDLPKQAHLAMSVTAFPGNMKAAAVCRARSSTARRAIFTLRACSSPAVNVLTWMWQSWWLIIYMYPFRYIIMTVSNLSGVTHSLYTAK
ncbi:Ubiquitin carboxyl-terminal hydrolase 47 [Homalodisca vitripennis]|nr:Ubiquitin carboxyl-terminal hydrolase 47 [Homalodisca vitripennis]